MDYNTLMHTLTKTILHSANFFYSVQGNGRKTPQNSATQIELHTQPEGTRRLEYLDG